MKTTGVSEYKPCLQASAKYHWPPDQSQAEEGRVEEQQGPPFDEEAAEEVSREAKVLIV